MARSARTRSHLCRRRRPCPQKPALPRPPTPDPSRAYRILDLSQGITGPYCTKLFADYGAEVTKIEQPGRGDVSRRFGPFPGDEPHRERSGMFLELNTGKRSVTLNLKTRSGREILLRLAEQADLAVESFRPGALERLGIGDPALREANPALSLVRISNFGQHGPYRDFAADDMLAYAMGGVLSITAMEGRTPVKLGVYAPLFLAGGVVAAYAFGAFSGGTADGPRRARGHLADGRCWRARWIAEARTLSPRSTRARSGTRSPRWAARRCRAGSTRARTATFTSTPRSAGGTGFAGCWGGPI